MDRTLVIPGFGVFLFLIYLFCLTSLISEDIRRTPESEFSEYISSVFQISGLPGLSYGVCVKESLCSSGGLGVYSQSTKEKFGAKSIVPLGNFSSILTRLAVLKLLETKRLRNDDLLEKKIKFLSGAETGIVLEDLLKGRLGEKNDEALFNLPGNSLKDLKKLELSIFKNLKEGATDPGLDGNFLWEDILLGTLLEEIHNTSYKEVINKLFTPPISSEIFNFPKKSNNKKIIHYEYFFGTPIQHKIFPESSLFIPALYSFGNISDLMGLHGLVRLNTSKIVNSINFNDLGFEEFREFGNQYYIFSGKGQGANFSILIDLNNHSSYYILTNITANMILDNILKNYIYKLNGMETNFNIYSIDKVYSLVSLLEVLLSTLLILFLGIKIANDNISMSLNFSKRLELIINIFLLFFLFLLSYYFFLIYPSTEYIRFNNNLYNFYGHIYNSDFKISTILLISILIINFTYYYLKNY